MREPKRPEGIRGVAEDRRRCLISLGNATVAFGRIWNLTKPVNDLEREVTEAAARSILSNTAGARHGFAEMSKASKHLRDCPAAGRAITSRECGEGRHSQFSCPAECPHNPLSAENYDQFGDIEGRVIRKTIDFFLRENRGNTALLAAYDAAIALDV